MSEPFAFRHLNRLVGAFVISSAMVLLVAVVLIGRARHWLAKEFTVTVAFDRNNLGLLRSGLPVKIQGTDAGEVVGAKQDADHTVARLALREEFRSQLRRDAKAIIHTPIAGFLGETFIEVWPGQEDAPFDIDTGLITQLPGDDLLQQARYSITNFGQASAQLRDLIADNRQEIASTVTAVRATAVIVSQVVTENRQVMNDALTRMEAVAREVAAAVAENRPNLKATTDALPATVTALKDSATAAGETARKAGTAADAVTTAVTEVSATAQAATGLIHENRDELALALGDLQTLLRDADGVAQDLKVATAQVAAGKGSLGKLVMEDTAHDKAVGALDNANKTMEQIQPLLTTITTVKLYLGVAGGGNLDSGVSSGSAWLRLEPGPDKFYQGGVTARGAPRALDPDIATSSGIPFDFDLLVGWRFFPKDDGGHWLSFGGGVLESRLGGMVSSQVWGDRLGLEVQVRGKQNTRDETDRRYEDGTLAIRATATLRLAWRLYALAGVDDLADKPGAWVGGRFELLDNDLRNLTTFGPLFR
jgi:ABC-type transporter Mla subunit MlaD